MGRVAFLSYLDGVEVLIRLSVLSLLADIVRCSDSRQLGPHFYPRLRTETCLPPRHGGHDSRCIVKHYPQPTLSRLLRLHCRRVL